MMIYILVIWTVVAANNYGDYKDWRPFGEFKNATACLHAAKTLDIGTRFRCLPTDTVPTKKG